MAIGKDKTSIQITLPKEIKVALDKIVKTSRANGFKCSKSIIIGEALLLFFAECKKQCEKLTKSNSEKEVN